MTDPTTDPTDSADPTTPVVPAGPRTLERFPETLAVVQLPSGADVPDWAESSSLFTVTADATGTSLVCAGRSVPTKTRAHRGLTGFVVHGLAEAGAGVLVGLLAPLASVDCETFVVSTYDSAWILVPARAARTAADAWTTAGHTVVDAVPAKPKGRR